MTERTWRSVILFVSAAAVAGASCGERGGGASGLPETQLRRVAEMTTDDLQALDRERTAVILPVGILEQHGPYLPSFTDGYVDEHLSFRLAEAVARRPGWTALMFPTIPLGVGRANELGGLFSFPGTYAVRSTTLRAVFMDLADELGEQGFRWIFIMTGHGAPNQHRALNDAGDYFQSTYGGRMVHLLGLEPAWSASAPLPEEVGREDGFGVHGGTRETSTIVALRPDLVASDLRSAPSITVDGWPGLREMAGRGGWKGYVGAPRLATADIGEREIQMTADAMTTIALRILDGADPRQFTRWGDEARKSPANAAVDAAALIEEARRETVQRDWLARQSNP